MARVSAGLLMYRRRGRVLQVFLVHLGGPFWARKDRGAWSIPKGEYAPEEDPLAAAQREFQEETGFEASGPFVRLTPIKQPGGKVVQVWAFGGDCDPTAIRSNTFSMEWPPRSGKHQEFPEIDRADWFAIDEAKERIVKGQIRFLEELQQIVASDRSAGPDPEAAPSPRR